MTPPPVPQPASRPAYRDPRLQISVTHILTATHLVLAGHPLLHVQRHAGGRIAYHFGQEAEPALKQFERAADELAAYRERAFRAPSPSSLHGVSHAADRQQ
jgi:hypothetical protein